MTNIKEYRSEFLTVLEKLEIIEKLSEGPTVGASPYDIYQLRLAVNRLGEKLEE